MVLGYKNIKKAFDENIWKTNSELHIGPNSVDVRLSDNFLFPPIGKSFDLEKDLACNLGQVSVTQKINDTYKSVKLEKLLLNPQQFVLGCTIERIDCSAPIDGLYYFPCYESRSTMARLGIFTHLSAGFGDYGFNGAFTLEIFNISQNLIIIPVGMRVGQVYFVAVSDNQQYMGSYNTVNVPIGPRV